MTSLRLATFAALCATALTIIQAAAAQDKHAAGGSKKLAVTVLHDGRDDGHPFEVSENAPEDAYAEVFPPKQLPEWKRPEGEPPLTRVRLGLTREGDAVRIKVVAVLDDSVPADAPGPKYGARTRQIASYLAHEGETVSVKELKGFGFEPLMLAVSEAKPEPEMPVIPAPARAVSRLKSVEVVSFQTEGAEMERARLVVRNVSPKNIVGLEINSDGFSNTAFTAGPRPLIASGATYETETGSGRGGSLMPGGGYAPAPQPDALVVGAAVFEDDSYEGDAKTAATMVARRKGRHVQFARVIKLLQGVLGPGGLDAPGALARLKSQVDGLRIDVEPSALDELVSRFTEIPRDECRRIVAESAVDGMRAAKGESLRQLEQVESARAQKVEGFDLRRQLEDVRAVVEKRAGIRRD